MLIIVSFFKLLSVQSNLNSCICGFFNCLQKAIVSRIKSHSECTIHYSTYTKTISVNISIQVDCNTSVYYVQDSRRSLKSTGYKLKDTCTNHALQNVCNIPGRCPIYTQYFFLQVQKVRLPNNFL